MAVGIWVTVLGIYTLGVVFFWWPTWQGFLRANIRHFKGALNTAGEEFTFGLIAFAAVLFWPLIILPLLSAKMWTGHWTLNPNVKKVLTNKSHMHLPQ